MIEKREAALSIIDGVDTQQLTATMQNIARFQAVVQGALKQNHDFGVIPGTPKPTLLKPGAEKILMLMGLTSEYEILERVENYNDGVFAYTVKCTLSKGAMKVTEGLGSCNSKEDKYRWRWVWESDLPQGIDKKKLRQKTVSSGIKYRIENEDVFSQVNTILKMAKKRAQVDAVLTVAALSELFTQDIEDMDLSGEVTERSYTPQAITGEPEDYILTFGKHKGERLGDIPAGYVEWLSAKAKSPQAKEAATQLLAKYAGKQDQKNTNPPEELATDEQVAEIGFLLAELEATEEEINTLKEKCGIKNWDELTAENATKLKAALEARMKKVGKAG